MEINADSEREAESALIFYIISGCYCGRMKVMKIRFSNEEKVFNINNLKSEGIPYLSFRMLDGLGVPNLFSTRYESYNEDEGEGVKGLRPSVLDSEDAEAAAPAAHSVRGRLARQLGSSIELEGVTDQQHTNHVYVIKEEDLGIRWPDRKPTRRSFVDGVVTDLPGVVLTAFGGDCPPVYIADPVRGAIGLVHAGWKGTLGRIPEVAIAQMVVHFGSEPSDLYAAIGPGICRDCYEMGDEIYEAFEKNWGRESADRILSRYPAGDAEKDLYPEGKYHLDLREANRMTLLGAGVREDRIAVSNICTMCNKDVFYSYRAGCMENHQTAMMVNRFGNV